VQIVGEQQVLIDTLAQALEEVGLDPSVVVMA